MTFRRLGKGRAWWSSTLISIMVIYGMNELCISMNRPVALVEPGSVFQFFLVDIQGDGAPPVRESKSFNRYCKMLISNRSEEHTSELQSRGHLVCRLLLEKKNSFINCI